MKIQADPWPYRFMTLAETVAQWSKDPSTRVGAVIVDFDKRVLGIGYNGFARGVYDHDDRYQNRPLKYKMVVHAEANAILNASRASKCILYCTMCPCAACASLIIQAGIVQVVYKKTSSDARWEEDHYIAKMMLDEAHVSLKELDYAL